MKQEPHMAQDNNISSANTELATLGGGCFWCTEAVFQLVRGVLHVESGYAGGHTLNPTYEDICTGQTGHAEVVKLRFDPSIISYEHILHIFFNTHDATTLNRQGHDVGTQYRSVIFTHSSAQASVAAAVIAQAQAHSPSPIVTQVLPLPESGAGVYTCAEAYHQNYYNNHPFQGYCAGVVGPKVAKFRQTMQTYLKT
jgi:peptide-methionine (S)-S-oxide reductase